MKRALGLKATKATDSPQPGAYRYSISFKAQSTTRVTLGSVVISVPPQASQNTPTPTPTSAIPGTPTATPTPTPLWTLPPAPTAPPCAPSAHSITVSSATELSAAFQADLSGETIFLAPGEYGDFGLSQRHFTDFVSLCPLDPQNPPVFGALDIRDSSYLRFNNIVVHHPRRIGEADWSRALNFERNENIQLVNSTLYGSDDGDYQNDIYGALFSQTTHLLFENNDVSHFTRGSIVGPGDDITVRGNFYHDIRSDGADFGGVVNVRVENNKFKDFFPCCGDHPDHIQFWNDNGTRTMQNVLIRGNTSLRGVGEVTQSIFIQSNTPAFPNKNFQIDHNVVYGGHLHGITIYDTDGVVIEHNSVLADYDPDLIPSINADNTSHTTVRANVATAYDLSTAGDLVSEDNVLAQNADPRLPTHYDHLFVNPYAGAEAIAEDFRPKPGSALIRIGEDVGALDFNFQPTALTAYLLSDISSGAAALAVQFDGSLSADPSRPIVSYAWNFGDGQLYSAISPAHVFNSPGTYLVSLVVTNDLAQTAEAHKLITVTTQASPDFIFAMDFDLNYLDVSGHEHPVSCSGDCPLFTEGRSGSALAFDGSMSGPYLNVPHRWDLDGMPQLSVAFWAKKGNAAIGGVALKKHVTYSINVDSSGFSGYLFTQQGGETRYDFGASAGLSSDTEWHHYAMTYDGQMIRLYVDGVQRSSLAATGLVKEHPDRDIVIGKDPWGPSFAGKLDELRIYAKALSANEIASLANP